jgi:anti-repressor protein
MDFSLWIKDRIKSYGFIDGVDYIAHSPKLANESTNNLHAPEGSFVEGRDFSPISGKSTGGRPTTEYGLSLHGQTATSRLSQKECFNERKVSTMNISTRNLKPQIVGIWMFF